MPYASAADFTARFGAQELTDLTGSAVDTPQLDQALGDAGDEIDTYLSVRYQLPLDPIPSVLVRVCCDIARYRLWDKAASEEVANRYAQAVKFLTAVSTGVVQLGVTPPPTSGVDDPVPLFSAGSRTFSADSLADYLETN